MFWHNVCIVGKDSLIAISVHKNLLDLREMTPLSAIFSHCIDTMILFRVYQTWTWSTNELLIIYRAKIVAIM